MKKRIAGEKLFKFENEYGEEFVIYQKRDSRAFYITGDEFDWEEYYFVIIDYGVYTAVDAENPTSFGFQFSAGEDKFLKRFVRSALIGKMRDGIIK